MGSIGDLAARKAVWVTAGSLLAAGAFVYPSLERTGIATPVARAAPAVPAAPANGLAGFVVSSIDWATGPDADKTSCPNGMTTLARRLGGGRGAGPGGAPAGTAGARAANPGSGPGAAAGAAPGLGASAGAGAGGVDPAVLRERFRAIGQACEFPEKTGPDALHRTVVGAQSKVYGLDLDGRDSRKNGKSGAGTCTHDDFRGVDGEAGIDNQFYRAVGCSEGWQASGGKRQFGQEMLTGAWGILISLRGVDSLANDDAVEVGIYANADPVQLSSARAPLSYASYNPEQDSRFRAETRGRIVDGVLITDPVDVRFHSITNAMHLERPIDAARLRMKILPDGSLDGVLGGYAKVDELYDFVVGYRTGKDAKGQPARQRFGSAGGSAASAGISCNGLYHAMKQLADGERDPKTGQCTAISHAYRIKAMPAFVVEKPAQVASRAEKR